MSEAQVSSAAAAQAQPRNLLARLVGVAVVALVAVSGVKDLRLYSDNWATWGPLGPDDALPVFTARGLDGPELNNEKLQGKVTVLAFWATWCGPCSREMPTLQALSEHYAGTDARVIGVNRDREGDVPQLVRAYKAERQLSFDVVYDSGRMGQAFRVSLIPHMVIVDREGRIRYVHQGQVGEGTLRDEIDGLLAEG